METNRTKRTAIVIAIVLAAVMALAFAGYNALSGTIGQASQSAGSSQAGNAALETAPATESDYPLLADYDSTVFTAQGEPRTLTEIADGRVLVMNFWATWCPYCIQEMDDYQAIFDDYGNRVSFAFIDATDGTRETVDIAESWLSGNGHGTLPAFYDTQANATADFTATSLPTTVIVDARGNIVSYSVGRIDPAKLRQVLDSLLAG